MNLQSKIRYPRASCKNTWHGFLVLGSYILSILTAAGLGSYVCRHYSLGIAAAYSFFAIIFIATRFLGLRNIVHECSHNFFVPFKRGSKNINALIGHFWCQMECTGFKKYQTSHKKHHAFLGDPLKDEDCAFFLSQTHGKKIYYRSDSLGKFLSYIRYCCWPMRWARLYLLSFTLPRFPALLLNLALYAALCFLLGTPFFLLFCVLPYFTVYQIMKLSSDYLDHFEAYHTEKPKSALSKARNHIFSSTLLNLLFLPRNDAYHLVHHLYPSIPTKFLPLKHKELLDTNISYAQKDHAVF